MRFFSSRLLGAPWANKGCAAIARAIAGTAQIPGNLQVILLARAMFANSLRFANTDRF